MQPYDCPNCGWQDMGWDDDPSFVERKNERHVSNPEAMDIAREWTEVHKCPDCGTVWEYENSTY